jgi:hypothetical protein
VLRRSVVVLVVAIGLVLTRGAVAAAIVPAPVAGSGTAVELVSRQATTAQVEGAQGADPPQTQDTTDDGTQLYQLIAAGLLMLAGLMVILTWGYWKATTPTAAGRRRSS